MIGWLICILKFEEGFSPVVYIDSEGYPSIGYGYLLSKERMTIKQARKYYPFVWTEDAAEAMMLIRIRQIQERIVAYPAITAAYSNCSEPRKVVLLSMAYQMGCRKLNHFKKTLSHLANGENKAASLEGLDSKWAKQTPLRAYRHTEVLHDGDFHVYKGLL